jgi:LPPG:FO 2-phospho-L-lactate transferase
MTTARHVVLLVGGVGGAKLAYGLAQVLPPGQLSIVVNTADDFELHGLHISPDVDTVMYTLAGLANPETGWGIGGDTLVAKTALARLGQPDWFLLGDQDLATHITRTAMLREGHTLTEVTAHLCQQLGVKHPLLPMTDAPVATIIETPEGDLAFQEYFVRRRWQPEMTGLRYEGAAQAEPSAGVVEALEKATLIVFGPSNPLLSIDPLLAVPGLRSRIAASPAPRVAVSPIIGGQAIKGPAAKIMSELGMEVSPVGVAAHYGDLLTGMLLDEKDRTLRERLEEMGLRVAVRPTLMTAPEEKVALANALLSWAEGVTV